MSLSAFMLSVLSSLAAILVLYLLYLASAIHVRRYVARAECWWLPGVKSFRFVIRNIPRKENLFGIRYRAWLRKDVPASGAISVLTFLNTDLVQGERLLLPAQQDLPVICFRLDVTGPTLTMVLTDKMGFPQESHPIDDDSTCLMVEFSVRARTWLLFKHEISRLYAIPQYRILAGKRHNIFRDDLVPIQGSHEQQMKSVLQYADEVTVTV